MNMCVHTLAHVHVYIVKDCQLRAENSGPNWRSNLGPSDFESDTLTTEL